MNKKKGKFGLSDSFKSQIDLQLMVIPGVICLILFAYLPMYGIVIAFQDYSIYDGFFQSNWVGLKHFEAFFTSTDCFRVIKNTLIISFLKLVIVFPVPILFALVLNEITNMKFKKVIQTVTYLPHFISWVIVGSFVSSMFAVDSGSVNEMLVSIGIIDEPINWLSDPDNFLPVLITANVWKNMGFNSIVYLAAIAGVNPALYEAATIDGCSRFKQIYKITLPCIAPVISIFLVLQIGNLLNAGFEDILVLTNNGSNAILLSVSEVIDTYVYKQGIGTMRYSYATAVGLFKGVLNVILLVAANNVSNRISGSSLW